MYGDQHEFYLTLFSNSSQALYPDNTVGAFTIELARPIELNPRYKWVVGLCEFSCPANRSDELVAGTHGLIYCNLIAAQLVGGTLARCLRTYIYPPQSHDCEYIFDNIYYLPVEDLLIKNVHVEILTLAGTRVPFESTATPAKLVLHIRRVHEWA